MTDPDLDEEIAHAAYRLHQSPAGTPGSKRLGQILGWLMELKTLRSELESKKRVLRGYIEGCTRDLVKFKRLRLLAEEWEEVMSTEILEILDMEAETPSIDLEAHQAEMIGKGAAKA